MEWPTFPNDKPPVLQALSRSAGPNGRLFPAPPCSTLDTIGPRHWMQANVPRGNDAQHYSTPSQHHRCIGLAPCISIYRGKLDFPGYTRKVDEKRRFLPRIRVRSYRIRQLSRHTRKVRESAYIYLRGKSSAGACYAGCERGPESRDFIGLRPAPAAGRRSRKRLGTHHSGARKAARTTGRWRTGLQREAATIETRPP